MRGRLVLAVACVALGLSACDGAPKEAVRELIEAAQAGEPHQAMARLGPRTRARLTNEARRASEQAGRRQLAPEELLGAGWATPSEPISLRVLSRSGDHAAVELRGRDGQRERLELVREGGVWKVELP